MVGKVVGLAKVVGKKMKVSLVPMNDCHGTGASVLAFFDVALVAAS